MENKFIHVHTCVSLHIMNCQNSHGESPNISICNYGHTGQSRTVLFGENSCLVLGLPSIYALITFRYLSTVDRIIRTNCWDTSDTCR